MSSENLITPWNCSIKRELKIDENHLSLPSSIPVVLETSLSKLLKNLHVQIKGEKKMAKKKIPPATENTKAPKEKTKKTTKIAEKEKAPKKNPEPKEKNVPVPIERKPSTRKSPTRREEKETPEEKEEEVDSDEPLLFTEYEIPIEKIVVGDHQPRNRESILARGSLTELKENIQKVGLLQPILVQEKEDGTYLLISGERRLRACEQLGHKKIRAVLPSIRTLRSMEKDGVTLQEIALFENLRRKDLTPIEEGNCFKQLLKIFPEMTQEELAKRLGLGEAHVSLRVNFLKFPEEVQAMIENGQVSASQARELLRLQDPKRVRGEEKRERLLLDVAKKIDVEKLTYKKAKELVDEALGEKTVRNAEALTRLGAKKAVYYFSMLHEKFDDIDLAELKGEEEKERLDKLRETLPGLIEKLQQLKKKVANMVK